MKLRDRIPRLSAIPVVPLVIVSLVLLLSVIGLWLRHRAAAAQNHVALSQSPKDVTVVQAVAATYQATHRYVGTLRPWVEARVGPQFVAAYVSSVEVRPGAEVQKGQLLATLDCRDASARSLAIEAETRALASRGQALSAQARRMTRLLDGGFVSANDVDQRTADSEAEEARLRAEQSTLVSSRLAVSDCVLRAPFDGEIGHRWLDPGAFVHPGDPLVSVVDRHTIRLVVDVPEDDFGAVAPGTTVAVHLLAVDRHLEATVSRRSPDADADTRTVHVEIDLPDPDRVFPVNTTAEIRVAAGAPIPALKLPLVAADLSGEKAKLFTVTSGVAHVVSLPVIGESGGDLYVAPKLDSGQAVILEGRMGLADGDRVTAAERASPPTLELEHAVGSAGALK